MCLILLCNGSSIKDVRSERGFTQMRTRGRGFDSMRTSASQLHTKACHAGMCSCMAILITPTMTDTSSSDPLATVSDVNDGLSVVHNLFEWLQSAFIQTDYD